MEACARLHGVPARQRALWARELGKRGGETAAAAWGGPWSLERAWLTGLSRCTPGEPAVQAHLYWKAQVELVTYLINTAGEQKANGDSPAGYLLLVRPCLKRS